MGGGRIEFWENATVPGKKHLFTGAGQLFMFKVTRLTVILDIVALRSTRAREG